jgi:hypothetical protein
MQGAGALKNWGIITSNLGASDFGIYQSTSNGGDPFTAGTPKLYISGAGNVGIGTSSPANYFTTTLTIDGSSSQGIMFRASGTDRGYVYQDGSFIQLGSNAGGVIFKSNDTERMRITSGGNVGINTTSPSQRLDIRDSFQDYSSGLFNQIIYTTTSQSAGFGASIGLGGVFTGTSVVAFGAIAGLKENGTDNNTAGYLSFLTRANAGPITEKLRISSAGFLFSIPTYNNTTGAAVNMYVDPSGIIARSTSSLKYKKDVRDYDKGLAEVLNMRSVYYKGISELDGDKQYAGLIAEEIQDLGLTEFVQYAEDGSPDALAYDHMVAILVKAIQELKGEVDSLKAQINN